MLTDVTIPGDKKCDEDRRRGDSEIYVGLIIESKHMWTVKGKAIPVIIGATGTTPKSLGH
jgi:hypothetical protein